MGVRHFIRAVSLVLATGAALQAAPVRACSILLEADPRVGSTAEAPVNQISLHFSRPVDPSTSNVSVLDEQGRNVVSGKPRGSDTDTVLVPVQPLGPGIYKVEWRMLYHHEDGDKTFPGSYSFTVK